MSQFKGFTSVELKSPKRSLFDLTHDKRLTTRMGRLTPVLITEAIPGDKFYGSSEMLVRMAPLLAPIYEQINTFVHFFFVPNRLLWEDWEEFITGGRLGVGIDPVNAPVPPYVDIDDFMNLLPDDLGNSSLAAYLGVPNLFDFGTPSAFDNIRLDVMPFAAYDLVYQEYYRDRNYIDDKTFVSGDNFYPLPSGNVDVGDPAVADMLGIKTRDYRKEYFTSALPFTQRGEEVLMPLSGTGTVSYLSQSLVKKSDGTTFGDNRYLGELSATGLIASAETNTPPTAGDAARIENIDEVLLTASSVSINDFRSAYALQVWLERNAVAGARYTESIQAHFDVRPQDERLQRPEYIGGGRLKLKVSEVVSTAWSNDGTSNLPGANLMGHGMGYADINSFKYFCPEHGFIIGILSIMNDPTYQQGLPRMFYARRSFLGYPWPTFAKLGEQPVDRVELFASPTNMTEDAGGALPLFGYQSRYADWKYIPNTNHGDFRTTLNIWSMSRVFASTPTLGETFVRFDDATQDNVFAVNGEGDNFWIYCHNVLKVTRALPYFGTPNTLNFA